MQIGIVGSGLMGGKLGTLFARAGHDVIFSYARSQGKLEALAQRAGNNARAGTPAEAANADVILLAVHWSNVDDALAQTGTLSGKVVLSCCVPLNTANTELVVAHTDSGAEALARKIPQARLVAAFQTAPSESFFEVFSRRDQPARPSQLYCSDDPAAKNVAAGLIEDVGFDPVDAGRLRVARYTEPFAMLTAELAYGSGAGPQLTYRFNWY